MCPSPDISHRSLFHRSAAVPSLAAQSPPCHHPTGLYHHCRHVGQALALRVPASGHLSTREYQTSITVFTQCSDCGVEPQMRGQTRLLPFSVNANHLPWLRVWLAFCAPPNCRVRPRMQGLTPLLLLLCKQKAGSAPAMKGTFPCVAREMSYLRSFNLPRLRSLLRERDHCINAGQWNPARRIWPQNQGTM